MNIQEEKRVCFDVDQNKQKINFLLKKNKENETQQSELNQKLATAQSDINSLSSAVETLQNANTGEEKIELLSYDIYRNRDNFYRNNRWEPSKIYFLCDAGAKFKLHIWFTINGTYSQNESESTVTTTFTLDDEEIFSQTDSFTKSFSVNIDYTGFFTSKKKNHKLVIKSVSSATTTYSNDYVKADILSIELWGTNVIFLTRRNDFHIAASPTQNLMTTTCIDQKARFSLQNADENLSMDKSNFRTAVFNTYCKELNQIKPWMYYYMGDDGPVYCTSPCLMVRFYPYADTLHRYGYSANLKTSETAEQYASNFIQYTDYIDIALSNNTTDDTKLVNVVAAWGKNIIFRCLKKDYEQFLTPEDVDIIDINGTKRLGDNSSSTPVIAIVTRDDGTNYLFECAAINKSSPSKFELGFGTNINAYSTPNGFVIYMRVGNDTKKLLVVKNSTNNCFEIVSTQTIKGIQEFWHGANGTHYERVGDKIFYYLENATTPTSELKLDI